MTKNTIQKTSSSKTDDGPPPLIQNVTLTGHPIYSDGTVLSGWIDQNIILEGIHIPIEMPKRSDQHFLFTVDGVDCRRAYKKSNKQHRVNPKTYSYKHKQYHGGVKYKIGINGMESWQA